MTSTLLLPGLVPEPVFLKSCQIRINVKLNFSLWLIKDQIRPKHELLQLFTVLKCLVRRTDVFLTSKSKVLRQMSVKLGFVSWQSVWCPLASMATSSRESGRGKERRCLSMAAHRLLHHPAKAPQKLTFHFHSDHQILFLDSRTENFFNS